MKLVTIAFASALALSAVAPAFAYENDLENGQPASSTYPGQHPAAGKRAGHHHANDARAYVPMSGPMNTPSSNYGAWDFGIGSQS